MASDLIPAGQNDPDHHYPTPRLLAGRALQWLRPHIPEPRFICDPGAGSGAWGEAARMIWPYAHITGIERRVPATKPVCYDSWLAADYVESPYLDGLAAPFDLIIGNPPFNQAEQFVRKSMELLTMSGRCFFLLRLGFLESAGRVSFFKHYCPTHVITLVQRPSFKPSERGEKTTDYAAYALFLWHKAERYHGLYYGGWLDWKTL